MYMDYSISDLVILLPERTYFRHALWDMPHSRLNSLEK